MKHLSIKSQFAGCGKTFTLCNFFHLSELPNKVLLTPTNKGRQVLLKKLATISSTDYSSQVMTLRDFKQNFYIIRTNGKSEYYTTATNLHNGSKWYNIFIDEYSMISKHEMKDLVENIPIQNIITAGDIHQFQPIPSSFIVFNNNRDIVRTADGKIMEFIDKGEESDLHIDHQLVLKKQMRSADAALNQFILDIKNADKDAIMNGIISRIHRGDIDYLNSMCIAYTKKVCNRVNDKVDEPHRWIVRNNDFLNGFYKGEVYEESDDYFQYATRNARFNILNDNSKTEDDYDDWFNMVFKPAYGINAHKLQGDTLDYPLYIFLDDILKLFSYSNDKYNGIVTNPEGKEFTPEELKAAGQSRAEFINLFHKFLYVAVTRATSSQNVHFVISKGSYHLLQEVIQLLYPMVDTFEPDAVFTDSDKVVYSQWLELLQPDIAKEVKDEWHNRWKHLYYDKRVIDYEKRKTRAKTADDATVVNDALIMSYNEWNAKYGKSKATWLRIRKANKEK